MSTTTTPENAFRRIRAALIDAGIDVSRADTIAADHATGAAPLRPTADVPQLDTDGGAE